MLYLKFLFNCERLAPLTVVEFFSLTLLIKFKMLTNDIFKKKTENDVKEQTFLTLKLMANLNFTC